MEYSKLYKHMKEKYPSFPFQNHLPICDGCDIQFQGSSCRHKDGYYENGCSKGLVGCGDIIFGCEKYECSFVDVCKRAYDLGIISKKEEEDNRMGFKNIDDLWEHMKARTPSEKYSNLGAFEMIAGFPIKDLGIDLNQLVDVPGERKYNVNKFPDEIILSTMEGPPYALKLRNDDSGIKELEFEDK